MTKTYYIQGSVATVTGKIVVTMNYSVKQKTGTHAITHDDYSKTIPLHKIEVFVNNKLFIDILNIESKKDVETALERQERTLFQHLTFLANTEPTKSFTEKLKDRGYE